jgi:glycosyltransferase involved in cell wall biosynthesis
LQSKEAMQTLIVFSHLRWDFVYQRPQHLLTRLARHYRILFVEEPVRGKLTPFLERLSPAAHVEVLRPHTTVGAPGFHDDQLPELRALLAEYLSDFGIADYLVWLYTPMALPLLAELAPRAVIYDCMDELSAFRDAPRQMAQRESALLKRAQLVLTGGPSLYEAKRILHRNVHCFPSAVAAEHYAPVEGGREADSEAERLLRNVPHPRLGFFGVIDERLDVALIAALADAEPGWQIMMVGPVVKIDPIQLPRRSNIHWLSQQPYERLPHLVDGWDVCLLPFALNESTRFISPTKTLEYMAAEKPIVSTPIRDVVQLYGDAVAIAETARQFLAACRAALTESAAARALRVARMRAHIARVSWDNTANAIAELMAELTDERHLQPADETLATLAKPAPADPSRIGWVKPVDSVDGEAPEKARVANAGGGKRPGA